MRNIKRIAIYLVGLCILTCGQRLFVQAGLGGGAFDSFCVGLAQYNTVSAGLWVAISSVILMLLSAFLEKRRPNFMVLISSFIFGVFFDCWGHVFTAILPSEIFLPGRILLYTVGLILAPLGTAIYFTTSISRSAYDEIIAALQTAFKLPIWASKTLIESTMLLLGFIVKGPIGITTIVTAFTFGPILQKYVMYLKQKDFHILHWDTSIADSKQI